MRGEEEREMEMKHLPAHLYHRLDEGCPSRLLFSHFNLEIDALCRKEG